MQCSCQFDLSSLDLQTWHPKKPQHALMNLMGLVGFRVYGPNFQFKFKLYFLKFWFFHVLQYNFSIDKRADLRQTLRYWFSIICHHRHYLSLHIENHVKPSSNIIICNNNNNNNNNWTLFWKYYNVKFKNKLNPIFWIYRFPAFLWLNGYIYSLIFLFDIPDGIGWCLYQPSHLHYINLRKR